MVDIIQIVWQDQERQQGPHCIAIEKPVFGFKIFPSQNEILWHRHHRQFQ